MRARPTRGLVLELIAAAACVAPLAAGFWSSLSGDAAVYFTYFRQFFDLPFSFRPGVVSFGATSPLHVMVHAPVHALAGPWWLNASRALNAALLATAIVFVVRAAGTPGTRDAWSRRGTGVVLAAGLFACSRVTFVSAMQLYETALACAAMSLLLFLLRRGRRGAALAAAVAAYLVRPEFAAVALAVGAYALRSAPDGRARRRVLTAGAAGAVLPLAYHVYMLAMTGRILPSSVTARAATAAENATPWISRAVSAMRGLDRWEAALFAVAAAAAVVLAVRGVEIAGRPAERGLRAVLPELALGAPLAAVYLAFPPGGYLGRYLVPLVPVAVTLVVRAASAIPVSRIFPLVTALALLAPAALDAMRAARHPLYDLDTLLLRDLAPVLDPVTRPGDVALVYEIQAQYALKAACVSLDGIVGGETLARLDRPGELETWIADNPRVRFVVTANAFAMRRLFARSCLPRLYAHDLDALPGATVALGPVTLRKMATNPVFADPALHVEAPHESLGAGRTIRVYGPGNRRWSGHVPLWNSVYEVVDRGKPASVPGSEH